MQGALGDVYMLGMYDATEEPAEDIEFTDDEPEENIEDGLDAYYDPLEYDQW